MKAVGIYQALPAEHLDALVDIELPAPSPGPMDLLVQVEAISVNPADCRVRVRKAKDGSATILGWDAAGTILATGSAASSEFAVGDKVFYSGDLTRPGANSEWHVVDSRIVGHRPRSLTPAESAAVPLTALTAWEALFDRIGFSRTAPNRMKSLLIVGGAGGVGSIAIQLARLVPGLRVIATASRPESKRWCRELGADDVIDHFGDIEQQLAAAGLVQVDAILLLNEPDRHFRAMVNALAPQGTMCCVVPFGSPPDINVLMHKSATLVWEYMFTRSKFGTSDMSSQRDILNTVAGLLDSGQIKTTATRDLGVICAANVRHAHRLLESQRTIGKLTLTGF